MNQGYQIIDGIKCYASAVAFSNSGFRPEYYERLFSIEERNFWFRSRNRLLHHLFEKHIGLSTSADYLEIGCGTGYVLKGLSDFANLKMTGAEVLLEGLRFAKKRLSHVEFVQFDATHMPYSEQFDAIGAFDVLEHIEDDVTVMENVWRALRPSGLFLITVPQHRFLWSAMDEIACHKRRYSRKELVKKLALSGFSAEFVSSFTFILSPLMIASRLTKRGKKTEQNENEVAMSELQLPGVVNSTLGFLMRVDEVLIRNGVRLPFGGSLIVVARKLSQ